MLKEKFFYFLFLVFEEDLFNPVLLNKLIDSDKIIDFRNFLFN